MSESAIRAQIKIILQGTTGIGAVHDYERMPATWADFLALTKSAGKVNGWMISLKKADADREVIPRVDRTYRYKIMGIYDLDDSAASEKTFIALCEAVVAAFASNYTLNGTAYNSDPISYEADSDLYADRKFHTVDMDLTVYDRNMY